MHPILFRIPLPGWELPLIGQIDSIPIYSYGVMLGLSLVVGWYLTLGLAEKDGLPRETMANNYVVTALAAVLAARLFYVITNPAEFTSLWGVISFRGGGLVAYGGFIGGFFGSLIYLRLKRIRLLPWADVAVPSLAAGTAITRIGCYLFGCDYGQPLSQAAPAWLKAAGTFPRWGEEMVLTGSPAWARHNQLGLIDYASTHSLPVHPTQLYESLVGVGLLALLLAARRRQKFRGQIFFIWAFGYGVLRFLLELLRDDPERGSLPGSMPEHVLISLCLFIFAAGYAVSFARMIENVAVRRVTQALAFVPAAVAYVTMRPESFAGPELVQLSTSQFIGLLSVALCGFYVVYDRAATQHPEAAMSLGLPEARFARDEDGDAVGQDGKDQDGKDQDGEDQDGDADERPRRKAADKPRRARKKARKGKRKADSAEGRQTAAAEQASAGPDSSPKEVAGGEGAEGADEEGGAADDEAPSSDAD